ncbi:MAG: YfiR family protein [Acidobacteriaceae bacterium]
MNALICSRMPPPSKYRGLANGNFGIALLLLVLAVLMSAFGAPVFPPRNAVHAAIVSQDDVEAAYLYNFAKFVTWPPNAKPGLLSICVLGNDPFGGTLDQIVDGETINGRHLEVVRLKDARSLSSCSIVFVGDSEAPHLDQDMAALAFLPALTVSDLPGFMEHGGTIQFVLIDNRVRFQVNLNAARKCGIVLSSQLLKVASKVVGTAPGEAAP